MDTLKTFKRGKIEQINIDALMVLAADALPRSAEEWGSDRQIDAENDFFTSAERVIGVDFEECSFFHNWMMRATVEESIRFIIDMAKALMVSRYCVSWVAGYGNTEPEHGLCWADLLEERWNMDEFLGEIATLKIGETFTYEAIAEQVVFYRSK